jgi:hypothetical protein
VPGSGFLAGDLDALMTRNETDATWAPEPGQVATDSEAIREAPGGFLAIDGTFNLDPGSVLQAGDLVALSFVGRRKSPRPTVNLDSSYRVRRAAAATRRPARLSRRLSVRQAAAACWVPIE